MTEFLVKRFVKNHDNVEDVRVRTAYGTLTSMVGISCNLLLFVAKLCIGHPGAQHICYGGRVQQSVGCGLLHYRLRGSQDGGKTGG